MGRTDSRLHGNIAQSAPVALLIIDMINDLEFDEGEALLENARPAAERLRVLKQRFQDAELPVIYVNDNYGQWQSDFHAQVNHCRHDGVRGQVLVELLEPQDSDYFVLKPKHSAFFSTTLDLLLDYLQVQSLVITGVATDICVLFSANDAYMRDFKLHIPADCVAANSKEQSESALQLMQRVLRADITPSDQLDLDAIVKEAKDR